MFFAPQEGVTLSTPATRPCRGTREPLSRAAVFTLQDRDDVYARIPDPDFVGALRQRVVKVNTINIIILKIIVILSFAD
jgi:hypothetical protein